MGVPEGVAELLPGLLVGCRERKVDPCGYYNRMCLIFVVVTGLITFCLLSYILLNRVGWSHPLDS